MTPSFSMSTLIILPIGSNTHSVQGLLTQLNHYHLPRTRFYQERPQVPTIYVPVAAFLNKCQPYPAEKAQFCCLQPEAPAFISDDVVHCIAGTLTTTAEAQKKEKARYSHRKTGLKQPKVAPSNAASTQWLNLNKWYTQHVVCSRNNSFQLMLKQLHLYTRSKQST